MTWNFNDIVTFGRQFTGPMGTELAFVFSEWTAVDGLGVMNAYPPVYSNPEAPLEDAPANRVARLWVKLNSGAWTPLLDAVPTITNVGFGSKGELQSGVMASMVIKEWKAKDIAAGYIVATGTTLDQINADRDTGLALIRTYINVADGEDHPLAPYTPFTSPQITALSTWLNDHGITNSEFAALFGVTAGQLANWLTSHTRAEFAQKINEMFT